MLRSLSSRLLALAAALFACTLTAGGAAVELTPLDWPNDTQMQFGIYNSADERFASAYYRILKEKVNSRTLYHFKYLGRNEQMSESAEVWVEPDTLLPVRSTRKVAGKTKTFFVDCAYEPGLITVRQKYEGQPVTELKVPTSDRFYDFEALYWMIPQIKWGNDNFAYINYFNTFKFQLETTIVTKDGPDRIKAKDKDYNALRYRFDIGSTRYTFWTVNQNGRMVPARILMDDADDRRDITFVNLGLDPKKVKPSEADGTPRVPQIPTQAPPFQPIPLPPAPAPPPPPPPPPSADEDEEEQEGEGSPLVPSTPGGRFE